jgi:hypothetical protein
MPYVYQITHRETGEFYIGSKYAIGSTPENTTSYLGSPKGKTERCSRYKYLLSNEKHFLNKVILGVFDTKEDALEYESEMHNKMFDNPLCLNGAKQNSSKFCGIFTGENHQMFGKVHSHESRKKMRLAKVGKLRGSFSAEHREKIKLAQIGRKFTEEHKAKLKLAKAGASRARNKIVVCPHCNKEGGSSGMSRYHFDYCKQKELSCQP